MVAKNYIIQMVSLSDSCCFGCQLVQWWRRGGGRSGWQLQPGCSANTLFTITSSHLAVVLESFVVYQPKERKRRIRFYTFVLNNINKLIARSWRLLRLLSIFDIENNLSVFDAEKSKTYQMFNLIFFVFLISCILVCFGNI